MGESDVRDMDVGVECLSACFRLSFFFQLSSCESGVVPRPGAPF